MISADLSGKTALVTGGASGIGLATVKLFAHSGATVAINDLPKSPTLERELAALQKEGLAVIAAPGDVGQPEGAGEMVRRAVDELGRLDYLINNAGGSYRVTPPTDLDALTEEYWQEMVGVSLLGSFRCTHAASAELKQAGGAVVNTASVAGLVRGGAKGSNLAYAASKAALISLTANLARGLGPEVRVNAVAPGLIRTPRNDHGGAWRKPGQEEDPDIRNTSLRRGGTPEDVAEVMLFLCAGAGYITGQTIVVDGGLLSVS